MEKQLTITLKGEGKHADIMEFNMSKEEIRDFFGEVTALLVLNKTTEYKHFKVALLSCAQTMSLFQKEKESN